MKKRIFVFLCLAILCFGSVGIVRGRNQEKKQRYFMVIWKVSTKKQI